MKSNAQKKAVLTCDVAKALPINSVFTTREFSDSTGIKITSCGNRINSLVKDDHLSVVKKEGVNNRFIMSKDQHNEMLKIKTCHKKVQQKDPRKDVEADEIEAYTEDADRTLRAVGFI